MADDNIQHGLDDDPHNDAEKGAALGGLGGAAVGAVAGSMAGPVGAVVGAVAGGLIGAGASGAAVNAVDKADNDNTVTGLGDGVTPNANDTLSDMDTTGNRTDYGTPITTTDYDSDVATGATAAGPAAGYRSGSDFAATGATSDYDRDYGTGSGGELSHDQRNATTGVTSIGGTDMNADTLGNGIPGVQTGGTDVDGTPDTRGITEKAADAITGDKYDDKTGKRVDY